MATKIKVSDIWQLDNSSQNESFNDDSIQNKIKTPL